MILIFYFFLGEKMGGIILAFEFGEEYHVLSFTVQPKGITKKLYNFINSNQDKIKKLLDDLCSSLE